MNKTIILEVASDAESAKTIAQEIEAAGGDFKTMFLDENNFYRVVGVGGTMECVGAIHTAIMELGGSPVQAKPLPDSDAEWKQDHILTDSPFRCDYCNASFSDAWEVRRHERICLSDPARKACPTCYFGIAGAPECGFSFIATARNCEEWAPCK